MEELNRSKAKEILDNCTYPTALEIKAFAIEYPALFRWILNDNQIKNILEVV